MNFLNPLVLFGLIAASIPLILHLLNLRKMKKVEFSSLKFLKELQKTQIRKFKIKQILLLIIRTLLIIFIVLAFARPTINTALPFFQAYSKSSNIIIIDNSFSMDISDENGNRLKQAKLLAQKIVNSVGDGDEVSIIEMTTLDNPSSFTFSLSKDVLLSNINKLQISTVKADLNKSLKIAAELSDNATYLQKNLFIITDGQENILEIKNKDTANIINKFNNLYFVNIGANTKSDIQNLSIDSLNLITTIFNFNKMVETDIIVKNYSRNEIKDAVASMIYDSQRVAQRSFNIPMQESRNISIGAPIQKYGATKVKIELENDALIYDNIRYYGIIIPDKPKILVNEAVENSKFIEIALKSVSENDEFARVDFFKNQKIASLNIESYDLIILNGITFSEADADRIKKYIEDGGSVLLFPNNDFPNMNMTLSKLGLGGADIKTFATKSEQKFSTIEKRHPLFEGVFKLNDNDNKSIESPNIIKIFPPKSGNSIIGTPSGNFLTEHKIGDGKLLYISVAPNLQWGNFPITGIFPTIIYRSTVYLTSSQEKSNNYIAGEPIVINIPLKYQSNIYKVIEPNGNETFVNGINLPGNIVLNLPPFIQYGNYLIENEDGRVIQMFSINPIRSESNLRLIEKEKLKKYLVNIFKNENRIKILDNVDNLELEMLRSAVGTELWKLFLILAILMAIAEMFVQKIAKRELAEQI